MRLEDIVKFLDSEYKTLLEMIIIEYDKRVRSIHHMELVSAPAGQEEEDEN